MYRSLRDWRDYFFPTPSAEEFIETLPHGGVYVLPINGGAMTTLELETQEDGSTVLVHTFKNLSALSSAAKIAARKNLRVVVNYASAIPEGVIAYDYRFHRINKPTVSDEEIKAADIARYQARINSYDGDIRLAEDIIFEFGPKPHAKKPLDSFTRE